MASIQKSELHRISKHPSSLHPKQIHASQHPQDVFKHPRGTDSNVPQEDTQKHLDTRDADGWETVTGRHSRYRNGKQSNLQSREILPPSIENTDTSSLSSLLTETSPFSNGPPHSSQTIGNKNNAKPNAAKEKRPIEEKEQGRPIISTVEVSKYKEEEEVTKKKSITTNKLKAQQINWQNVACALNTLNISIAKVIHLMYSTDSLFKDICKFLGKKSSKSNLYSIHKTCRRYYHQIHLAEGIFTCDLLYCNGTPLVDPPFYIVIVGINY
uniref:Uncharacterized protein n=1 Tax=Cacopsylla melanoneura TaxID=428564 RepID=A0A8D8SXJ8_9HEMI